MDYKDYFYKKFLEWKPRDWWSIFNKDLFWSASNEIKGARLHTNISQQELAERVGTTQSSIARFERGRSNPTIGFLRKLANAMGYVVLIEIIPLQQATKQYLLESKPILSISFSSKDTVNIYTV